MSTTLKKNFLKLLEKDIEFRYAVAGYLGLSEILKRFDKLEEERNKLFEGQKRILENIEKIWEEIRLLREEQIKQSKILEEHSKVLKEHSEILKEHSRVLEEHSKALGQLIHGQGILGMELGALTESTYANFLLEDLSKIIASNKESILLKYRNERINEKDIDLLVITERHAYIAEIKIHPRIEDINELLLKKDIIIKNYPDKEVIPILTGTLIGKDIEQYAKSKNVKVYKY